MDGEVFVRGLLIGLAVAMPVGPIGMLCIRRTLTHGRLNGFAAGLGAATADAAYGAVAALGLSALSSMLVASSFWLRLVGGLFLLYLGATTLLAQPAERPAGTNGRGLLGAYASTFALTSSNPLTILSFATIFAGAGAVTSGVIEVALLVLGVLLGSALWWLLLSGGVSVLYGRLGTKGLRWVNRVAGAVLLAFAATTLAGLLG
jgi:threonine/homoserine/homoserine lactone efflux protein